MKIQDKTKKVKGRYKITTFKAGTNEVLRELGWVDNLVVLNANSGMNLLLKHLAGDTTYPLEITQAKIGTSDQAPADADTDLITTFLDGILVAVIDETAVDTLLISFFIADAELTEQDYKEFGIFCGNRLFARSLISPVYSKSVGEDTRIDYEITVTN